TLPFSAIWDAYCMKMGVPVGEDWLKVVREYEKNVLAKR
ncbi:MAG: L-rhamnose isomerase, partial [Clostridia bacterium]|nr:L-rhamnose isomerase [Clostridia bacterium]